MSLPSLNPDKTASGIVVDPSTLERVIPASKRKDGSVRKEQKVRAGFVPQEDMSAFRGRRQLEAEARRGGVPGSNSRMGLGGAKAPNSFAQQQQQHQHQQQQQSRAAAKNAQRSAKRAEAHVPRTVHRNWDSESDDEDEEEATRLAFAALKVDTHDQRAFPPLGGNAGSRRSSRHSRSGSVSPVKPGSVSPKKSAWKTIPEPAAGIAPAPNSAPLPSSTQATPSTSAYASASDSASTPSWRSGRGGRGGRGMGGGHRGHAPSASWSTPPPSASWDSYRPHPIQGGRKGPIGLAHPPPIEPAPRGRGRGRGGVARGGRGGRGGHATHASESWRGNSPAAANGSGSGNHSGNGSESQSSAPERPPREPRERAPVRVREGGPLADRVRSLLLQNQATDRPRRGGNASTPSTSAASGASGAIATSGASASA